VSCIESTINALNAMLNVSEDVSMMHIVPKNLRASNFNMIYDFIVSGLIKNHFGNISFQKSSLFMLMIIVQILYRYMIIIVPREFYSRFRL